MSKSDEFIPFPILRAKDFPENYICFAHPNDYKESDVRIIERFKYKGRKFIRMSVPQNGRYVPITFICDPKRPYGIYLSHQAMEIFGSFLRVDDLGFKCMRYVCNGKKIEHIMVEESNQPCVNIIGGLRF